MLHICDVNSHYSPTGGGIRTYHRHKLAFYRKRSDVRYTLMVPAAREYIEREANVTVIGIRGLPVPGAWNYRLFTDFPAMRRHLLTIRPDIVEIGSPYAGPVIVPLLASGLGSAFVGFWHTHYPAAYVGRVLGSVHPRLGEAGERAAWWWARRTYGRLDATFAAAACIADELRSRGIRRVLHTPLGTDTELFHPSRRDEALRRQAGAALDRPLLLFPHRLLEEKGLYTLLRAFPKIRRETGAVFVFAGNGRGTRHLRRFAEEHDGILFLDHIGDPELLARWYASSDAVFALSAFETFGLSAAEAMASGCALIGCEDAGIGELIRNAECGVTVPYGNATILAEAAVGFLASGRLSAAGKAARSYAERFFDWNEVFERQLGYYVRVCRETAFPLRTLPYAERDPQSITDSV